MGTTIPLKDLEVYKISHNLGNEVWKIVSNWSQFERDTLGVQLVKSIDSVSLNICEGHGRYFFKDKRLFFYYSRGSLYEAEECLIKAYKRNLIIEEEYINILASIRNLSVKLNNLITSLNKAAS